MKTRKDAERVVELSDRREKLLKLAGGIRMADAISVCDGTPVANSYGFERYALFNFDHLADELRDLIKREAAEQTAVIDKELKALGVEPDEFEAAAPEETAKRVVAIKQR